MCVISRVSLRGKAGFIRKSWVRPPSVNRLLDTFTLAVQTRVKNFQFTLYGGPERFGKSDFIKSDQNGYSRGWVRSREDIQRFVTLASIAHERKRRR